MDDANGTPPNRQLPQDVGIALLYCDLAQHVLVTARAHLRALLAAFVTVRVYAPNTAMRWPRYRCRWYMVPWVFVVMGIRGLRARWWPARGRSVTLADMLAMHPPGRAVCKHCRGTGIDRSGRDGRPAIRFCPKMLMAFRAKAGFRVIGSPPRWLAGFEPERLVR